MHPGDVGQRAVLIPMGIPLLLRLAAVSVCFGYAAYSFWYNLPLRALVWDQDWWGWYADLQGYSWKDWVTSARIDRGINTANQLIALVFFTAGALLSFRKGERWGVVPATLLLLLLHFLVWKEHFWQIGQLLELCLQSFAPLLLVLWGKQEEGRFNSNRLWLVARWLTALTFVGHGLYAAGIHPVPANFVLMVQAGLGVGEPLARGLLQVVGVLDFIAAALLLTPNPRAIQIALAWIIPWAVLTTLARLWSYGGIVSLETLAFQWGPEAIRRLPHILVPLAIRSWVTTAYRSNHKPKIG